MADDTRGGVIAAVKTPLGLFALVVLVVEALIAGLAVKAEGNDFTILIAGLIFTLVLVVIALVLATMKDPSLLGAKADVRGGPAAAAESKYDAFVAAPMASFDCDPKSYQRSRNDILRLVKVLQQDSGARDIFYAGEHLPNLNTFEVADLSLECDIKALKESASLILVYPAAMATSALVEVGIAIALHKPIVIHVQEDVTLPFLLEHEQGATAQHGAIRIYRYKSFSDVLQIYRRNAGILRQITGRTTNDVQQD